jgi:hypothetical protein
MKEGINYQIHKWRIIKECYEQLYDNLDRLHKIDKFLKLT